MNQSETIRNIMKHRVGFETLSAKITLKRESKETL